MSAPEPWHLIPPNRREKLPARAPSRGVRIALSALLVVLVIYSHLHRAVSHEMAGDLSTNVLVMLAGSWRASTFWRSQRPRPQVAAAWALTAGYALVVGCIDIVAHRIPAPWFVSPIACFVALLFIESVSSPSRIARSS